MTIDPRRHPRGETDSSDWPPHGQETVAWSSRNRAASRIDRELTEVEVNLPPHIADLDHNAAPTLLAAMEDALRQVNRLDQVHGGSLRSLNALLIRTESVASSKIEDIEADVEDYARALHGIKANASATSMVAATEALAAMVDEVGRTKQISSSSILRAHEALMSDDPSERGYAGVLRDMQNWIGGTSDHSPIAADYVPPPPEAVEEYMADLVTYANRDDIPVLTQAAISHAQFESIHPFTDGNGRTGRALINAILRRRGVTTYCVVPLASAIVARRSRYFSDLGAYRSGHVAPLLTTFTAGAKIASEESSKAADLLAEVPTTWRQTLGRVRTGSATDRVLTLLQDTPITSADDIERRLPGVPERSVYKSIARLEEAGILSALTGRKRNQVWGASAVLDELDDLGKRIATRAMREI
ncbi:Fic family protein [Aeromicrobium sp. CF4.19]|uniref:Fic family protein n=1 Tax=Aeromicrobium sp. CF4.19 TaxID=3373082 RepID=UPI003EE50A3F